MTVYFSRWKVRKLKYIVLERNVVIDKIFNFAFVVCGGKGNRNS